MTKKTRTAVPKGVRDGVLAEFRHRCAICAADRPHLHHIDEDPSNNSPTNLLPLCPSCHLTDYHDPTRLPDPLVLTMLRKYRDPAILRPQFVPLLRRAEFLLSIDVSTEDTSSLRAMSDELASFVDAFNMGSFYGEQIRRLLDPPKRMYVMSFGSGRDHEYERTRAEDNREDRQQLLDAQPLVFDLLIELLRFQDWGEADDR